MTNEIFEKVKHLLKSFPHGECGLHDTISARRAIIETKNVSIFISLYDLAKDITRDSYHREAIKRLNSLEDYGHKRIVIWCLSNLYSREVYQILRDKQNTTKQLESV